MRELNLRRLRYFHEVLTRGSIRAAAEQLNTAPSVITRQLRLLEEEVGEVLFDRQARGMKATVAAQHLLEYWRGCQAQQSLFEDRLKAMHHLQTGSVRLAISEGYVDEVMENVVIDFCTEYPGVNIEVNILSVRDVVSEIGEGRADLGIAYNPPTNPKVSRVAASHQPVVVLMHDKHPLASQRDKIQVSELCHYPLAVMPPAFGLGELLKMLIYAENIQIQPILTTNSTTVLRHFATKHPLGITLVGGFIPAKDSRFGKLVRKAVDHPLFHAATARLLEPSRRPLGHAAIEMKHRILTRMPMFIASTTD